MAAQTQRDAASANPRSQGEPITDGERRMVLRIWGLTALFSVLSVFVAVFLGVQMDSGGYPDRWFSFVVPTTGGALGLLLGFLYSTVGRESKRFGGAVSAINSALAGASIADLAREDGLVRVFFRALAKESGLPDRPAVVAALFVASGITGFLWMYCFKTIGAGRALLVASTEADQYERDLKEISSQMSKVAGLEEPVEVSKEVKRAAKRISDDAREDSAVSDKDRGKALYLQGRYVEAAEALRRALAEAPRDRGAQLYLANALNAAGRQVEAIPVLEELVDDPAGPMVARKLLAYAYLYLEDSPTRRQKLERSRDLSRQFLAMYPSDSGAALNESCAMSQLARIDKASYWADMLTAVRKTIVLGGSGARDRIAELSQPGQDFAWCASDPEFQKAIS